MNRRRCAEGRKAEHWNQTIGQKNELVMKVTDADRTNNTAGTKHKVKTETSKKLFLKKGCITAERASRQTHTNTSGESQPLNIWLIAEAH